MDWEVISKWGFGAALAFYVIRQLFKLLFYYRKKNSSINISEHEVREELEKLKVITEINNQSSVRHEKIVEHLGDMTRTLADIDRTTYDTNKRVGAIEKDVNSLMERVPTTYKGTEGQ